MQHKATPLLAILLSVLMVLTGIGSATASGHMAAAGVICGDGTYAVVLADDGLPLFDSNGDPVEMQGGPCLDCIFSVGAVLPSDSRLPLHHTASSVFVPAQMPGLLASRWMMGGMGRSPPVAA